MKNIKMCTYFDPVIPALEIYVQGKSLSIAIPWPQNVCMIKYK